MSNLRPCIIHLCIVTDKAKTFTTAYRGLCAQTPTASPTSSPTDLLLAHCDPATVILPQRLPCFHSNLLNTFLSRTFAPDGSTAKNALVYISTKLASSFFSNVVLSMTHSLTFQFKIATLSITHTHIYTYTQSHNLSLSSFAFLHSTYHYLTCYIFYICTCLSSSSR